MKRLLLLSTLLFSTPAYCAIAVDATASSESLIEASSITYTHTTGTISNGMLIVGIGACNFPTDTVTYDGVTMTKAVESSTNSLWYLVSPHAGAHNVVATSLGGNWCSVGIGSISVSGVDPTGPETTPTSGTVTGSPSATATISTINDNAWVFSCFGNQDNGSMTAAGGQTEYFNKVLGYAGGSYSGPKSPFGAVTHTYTNIGDNWTWVMASFKPSGSVAASSLGSRLSKLTLSKVNIR